MKWYIWLIVAAAGFALLVWGAATVFAFHIKAKSASYQNMDTADLGKLNDEDLIIVVLDRTDAQTADVYEKLPDTVRTAITAALFDTEVNNGGLCQYLTNASRYSAPYLSAALKNIDAPQMRQAFDTFVSGHHISLADITAEKKPDYDKMQKQYNFNAFDNTFADIYKSENIARLTAAFIRAHLADFEK